MITIKSSKGPRPRIFHTKISIAFTFNLISFLINYDWLPDYPIPNEIAYMKGTLNQCFSCIFTWTPKKGKVAEPGFCGQAPGKGVIYKMTSKTRLGWLIFLGFDWNLTMMLVRNHMRLN